jgi:hypothetical protein
MVLSPNEIFWISKNTRLSKGDAPGCPQGKLVLDDMLKVKITEALERLTNVLIIADATNHLASQPGKTPQAVRISQALSTNLRATPAGHQDALSSWNFAMKGSWQRGV